MWAESSPPISMWWIRIRSASRHPGNGRYGRCRGGQSTRKFRSSQRLHLLQPGSGSRGNLGKRGGWGYQRHRRGRGNASPIADAFVMLYTDPTTPYQGYTNLQGTNHLQRTGSERNPNGFCLQGRIRNQFGCEFDAENITIWLAPIPDPSSGLRLPEWAPPRFPESWLVWTSTPLCPLETAPKPSVHPERCVTRARTTSSVSFQGARIPCASSTSQRIR